MTDDLLDTNHASPLVTLSHPLRERILQRLNADETDAELTAEHQISLRRHGWQLETVDALIAAVALRYDLFLLTADKDFRAVPKLQSENWLGA